MTLRPIGEDDYEHGFKAGAEQEESPMPKTDAYFARKKVEQRRLAVAYAELQHFPQFRQETIEAIAKDVIDWLAEGKRCSGG